MFSSYDAGRTAICYCIFDEDGDHKLTLGLEQLAAIANVMLIVEDFKLVGFDEPR